jgi:Flp pilus assembly pilin Flp
MEKNQRRNVSGQGIVEYILITALVALAMVAVFKAFRADVSRAYQTAGQALVQGVQDGVASDPAQ